MKKWIIGCIVLFIIAIVFYWKKIHTNAPITATITVTRGTVHEEAVAVGDIFPKHSITVKSQLSGIVENTMHESGDYVHKGDVLLQIKPNPTPEQYANAIALVKEDRAQVGALSQKLNNYKGLLKNNIITAHYQELVNAEGEFAEATAKLNYDEQSLELLTKGHATIEGQKIESTVVSPVDGYILERSIDVGDPVVSLASNQAATLLFTIANMDDLIFKGSVDEIDAGKLTLGLPATVTVAALPDKSITGVLSQLSLQAMSPVASDGKSASPFNVGFYIEISQLQLPTGVTLRSGYSATATIIVKTAKNVLIIPENAVLFKEHQAYVQVPGHKNEPAVDKLIETGLSDAINIEVISGLKEGDIILQHPILHT